MDERKDLLLADLAHRVDRLRPSHHDPEAFHIEKDEIAAELRRLARAVESGGTGAAVAGVLVDKRSRAARSAPSLWLPRRRPASVAGNVHWDRGPVRLREEYEADRKALAECNRVDECGDWVDRAAALACYAKEAKDQTLEAMAQRIRARAIRRAGELLRHIDHGGRPPSETPAGAHPSLSRAKAAADAGFSPHQAKQALRVAAVPGADFERQVETPTPPTVTELARQGKRARPGRPPASSARRPSADLHGRDPEEINRAVPFVVTVEDALRPLKDLDLEAVPLLPPEKRAGALNLVGQIDVIIDGILVKMSQERL